MGTSNREVARLLERVADLLETQEANPFRVRSYRRAAEELRSLREPVEALYSAGGRGRLEEIPGVGRALSGSLAEIVETGRLRLLERLEAQKSPLEVLQRLPGVGPTLAQRIYDELGVTTLEELEMAAHDGRLSAVEGIGAKRAQGIRDALAGRLARSTGRRPTGPAEPAGRPSVGLLLEIDHEYRRRAEKGELRLIAPRRFNPEGASWLPILEGERDGWEFTALFSNTRRAHELGRTRDWVVIYYHRDGDHGQATVVTSRAGSLKGFRVVRGREPECRRHRAMRRRSA